ncbi:reverse transcriptase domain-containing protein [Tanacetum coccineum]
MVSPLFVSKTKQTLPYPSRANKEKLREKDDLLASKFMEIFRNLHFELSFRESLLTHVPKNATNVLEKLLNDKEKIIELTNTPVTENWLSRVIPKKECVRQRDENLEWEAERGGLGGRGGYEEYSLLRSSVRCSLIQLYKPFSMWKETEVLPALTKTRMILELADQTISTPTGIAEDVFVKVGTFFLLADFVVVDYISDPRAPLILGRPFLRMARALIDVHGELMTLRHDDQSVTFKVGDTKTFSYNIIESVNRVDVIDIACEEYVQEVLEISESGNPTSTSDLMIDSRSPSFTPFGGSDFLMEEIDAFLEHDDSIPPGVDGIYDSEGDTVYLNPPDLELKDLPSHLEYAFLEGDDKLPVIIAKNLKDEDKTALIKKSRDLMIDKAKVDVIANCRHPDYRDRKEIMVVKGMITVYAFEKFRPYLVLSKSIVYTDHSALKYLLAKHDAKPRLLRRILLLQEFDVVIRDKKGVENLAADHLSRLENPHQSELEKRKIQETNFLSRTLGMVTFRGDE